MSNVITYADLVGCWPENPAFSVRMAEAMQGEDLDLAGNEFYDNVADVLAEVPEPKGAKHDDNCWKVHAPCLAQYLASFL